MYGIVEERLYLKEAGCYRTYGIRTVSGRLISDVCTERERLSAFVDELNAAGLEEIHLEDAIADFLAR